MNLINQTAAKVSHLEDLHSIQNIVFFLQFILVAFLSFNPSEVGVFQVQKNVLHNQVLLPSKTDSTLTY